MSRNYKDTLNLPKTAFPMKADLATREPEMLKIWEETRLYDQIQKARSDSELFVLHDGPPFARPSCRAGIVTDCRSNTKSSKNRENFRRWKYANDRKRSHESSSTCSG